ncbi:TIGR03808 family TAT-translocated repetitive protein [Mesorhizobium sp. ASY16-5R]|uniref:TIGR03808 family TAT-translocated repetitive protein n=1 Tax=Mesorhizobium sp. ASY16-5R TaxID=3445772 RepID=UPI003F9F9A40
MLNRRIFLAGSAGLAAVGLSVPAAAISRAPAGIETASLRGAISAGEFGVAPGTLDDQSKAFAKLLDKAAQSEAPVFLPPGTYVVSNITLPRRVRLSGVPGATRLLYGGDGHLLLADGADHIGLTGLVLDGANRWIGDYAQGLGDFRRVAQLVVDNCQILGSGSNGLALETVSGRIERTIISGAAESGIYSVEAGRLSIAGNTVTDCANGGILVHRWQPADDFTMVTNNRVERIAARKGGTGPYGNGINAFRADKVMIANNMIADCAFSAIRANSASDVQILNNNCARSGETAIYSEFAFQGAIVSANIVDGAANGIAIVNFDQGGRLAVCSGNLVRNISNTGPYTHDRPIFGVGITVEADTTLTGNVVEDSARYGMQLGWGPYLRNVSATGNIIRKAQVGIAVTVVEGAGPAVITDNIIEAASEGAVVGFRWTKTATGDLAAPGASAYSHLTVERNQVR